MATIFLAADAAADIIRRIASGELEMHGILVREAVGKKFRYILRGLENLPDQVEHLGDLPPLEPLRAVLSVQQLIGLIGIAQNAALAATLKRIEGKLDAMERQLSEVTTRLARVEAKANLLLQGMQSAPVSRLRAARNRALHAYRLNDRTALIEAAGQAEQAARDLLAQASHLTRIEEDGIPMAFIIPIELASIADSAASAMAIASSIHLALGASDIAAKVMHEVADTFADMRGRLAQRASDPEFMLRRLDKRTSSDGDILEAGATLRDAQHWTRGRAVLIDEDLIEVGRHVSEFESSRPGILPSFEGIGDVINVQTRTA